MARVRLTDAQITALESAGIFEEPMTESEVCLVSSIRGRYIFFNNNVEQIARIICDISNDLDSLAVTGFGDSAKWARVDARVLSNLYMKLIRCARAS